MKELTSEIQKYCLSRYSRRVANTSYYVVLPNSPNALSQVRSATKKVDKVNYTPDSKESTTNLHVNIQVHKR